MIYRYNAPRKRRKWYIRALAFLPALMIGTMLGFIVAVHVIYWIIATGVVVASHG